MVAMRMPNGHVPPAFFFIDSVASGILPMRKATNITLPELLLREAKHLGVNLSQACEKGLATAVAEARTAAWLRDNHGALESWNDYVEKNGLPLAEFRRF
jgi:antitoxin CcdA